MMTFQPFWEMMRQRNITTYMLEHEYHFNKSVIYRLKHNSNVTLDTVEKICSVFHCKVEDVILYVEQEEVVQP